MHRLFLPVFATVFSLTGTIALSADYQRGMDAAKKNDFETALKEWVPLAKEGDVRAQSHLGFMYENGYGVPQNDETAIKWYSLAAEQGDEESLFKLNDRYGLKIAQEDKTERQEKTTAQIRGDYQNGSEAYETKTASETMAATMTASETMTASAVPYSAIGGGYGGESDAISLTLEIGAVTTGPGHNTIAAGGLGIIFDSDDIPSDVLEYPVPHSDYVSLGQRNKGNQYALFGKYGVELLQESRLFIFGTGGFSFGEEIELARSNVTGWHYEQSSESKFNGMLGGGLSYFFENYEGAVSIEYDNRRGSTFSLSLPFN